jgi:hypothetical protein
MRTLFSILLVLSLSTAAWAQSAPQVSPLDTLPAAGTCAYKSKGIKYCTASEGHGIFEVLVAPEATVAIQFEEPINKDKTTDIDGEEYTFQIAQTLLAIATTQSGSKLPAERRMIVTAGSITATLLIRPVKEAERADTLVAIKGSSLAQEELERWCLERLTPEKSQLEDAQKHFEQRVTTRARDLILEQLAADTVDIDEPDAQTRRSLRIVIRGKRVVRMGKRRFVVLELENLSDTLYKPREMVGTWHQGKSTQSVHTEFQCLPKQIDTNDKMTCAAEVSLPAGAAESGRLDLRVVVDRNEHTVSLDGIRLR